MQTQAGGISKQADISRQPKQTNSEWRTGTEQPFLCSAQHIKRYRQWGLLHWCQECTVCSVIISEIFVHESNYENMAHYKIEQLTLYLLLFQIHSVGFQHED